MVWYVKAIAVRPDALMPNVKKSNRGLQAFSAQVGRAVSDGCDSEDRSSHPSDTDSPRLASTDAPAASIATTYSVERCDS